MNRTEKDSSNKTRETLAGTPFDTAEELKKAKTEILDQTWRELERARARKQLLQKEEYRHLLETFERGLNCRYGEESNGNLVRVFLGANGIQIVIDEKMKSAESSENLLGVLVESMSDSFLANYLKATGVIPGTETLPEPQQKNPSKKSSKKS